MENNKYLLKETTYSQGLGQFFPDLGERRNLNSPRNLMHMKFFSGS
jgi:hypothetical protein